MLRFIRATLIASICFGALVLSALNGCSSNAVDDVSDSRMVTLSTFYSYYEARNGGARPDSEASFRDFLSGQTETLKAAGLDSVDELFVSDRDGLKFELIYGAKLPTLEGREVFAHEQAGVDGSRMVGYSGSSYELVSAEQFGALKR